MALEVDGILPSQAIEEIHKPNSKLVRLVLAGYNLTDKAKQNPIEAASYDYNFPDNRATVFIAKHGEDVVGSVTLILWRHPMGLLQTVLASLEVSVGGMIQIVTVLTDVILAVKVQVAVVSGDLARRHRHPIRFTFGR